MSLNAHTREPPTEPPPDAGRAVAGIAIVPVAQLMIVLDATDPDRGPELVADAARAARGRPVTNSPLTRQKVSAGSASAQLQACS